MQARTKIFVSIVVVALAAVLGWFLNRGDDAPPSHDPSTRDANTRPASNDDVDATTGREVIASPPESPAETLGASVHGTVIDPLGAPQVAVVVSLVDARGQAIDRVTTNSEGGYELYDAALEATAIVVASERDASRPDGLARTLDPPLGDGEERLLDLVVGATRVVRGFVLDMQGEPLAGVFVHFVGMAFDRRWSTVSDLGGGFVFEHAPTAPLRVEAEQSDLGRDAAWVAAGDAEVLIELVLEPSARITVTGPPEASAKTRVRIRCVEDGCFGQDQAWRGETGDDRVVVLANGEVAPSANTLASIERVRAFVLGFAREFYPQLLPADADALELDALQRTIADRMAALSPDDAEALAKRMDPDAVNRYTAEHMPPVPEPPPARWSTVAEGALGTTFTVTADLTYLIELVDLGPTLSGDCGSVRPSPGDALDIACATGREAIVEGRVVDQDGHGRGGVALVLAVTPEAHTSSAADGRFRFVVPTDRVELAALSVTTETFFGGRRNVMVAPGETRDVGDLRIERAADRPERWPTEPHGGVGGLMAEAIGGVRIDAVEELGPLALAGVEDGDTIVRIADMSAADMTIEDALTRLRGEPGTEVGVRIRSRYGELYDVLIERGLVPPPHELLMQRFGEGPYPPGY